MVEILWNGRGGQGAFTAARLLGHAWSLQSENNYALAFPSFGPERRGAPIRAFTKLATTPIVNRSEIHKSDYLIYLDDTLFDETALTLLKPGGKIILNTIKQYRNPQIITIDANRIADEVLQLPITNTVMLGALAAVSTDITLDALVDALTKDMPAKLSTPNIKVLYAAKEALN